MSTKNYGKVYLVGAGPGDPELITLKGIKLLKKADVILYDNLASRKLLNFADNNAEIIYVGKSSNKHTYKQDEINLLLIEKARKGNIIVRLKGGDPFIFGRGGEEALALKKAGVEFEIVPGITSAIAAPAYSGIPVTHRGMTSSVKIVTGHETPEKATEEISYKLLAEDSGTLVFLMGVKNLEKIVNKLLENGKPPSTPVALIQNGTFKTQKVVTGNLDNIVQLSRINKFSPPGITVIGDVVNLREKLMWFEKKPLFGKRIVVTRTRKQASKLSDLLEEYGAEAIEIPTIEVKLLKNSSLKNVLNKIQDYDWVIFTSSNGVDSFFINLLENGNDIRKLSGVKIGVIGKQSAEQTRKYFLMADFYPSEFTSDCFADEFTRKFSLKNKNILLVQSNLSRNVIETALRHEGANVEKAIFYETRPAKNISSEIISYFLESKIDWVTFTSSSTADNFFRLLRKIPELEEAFRLSEMNGLQEEQIRIRQKIKNSRKVRDREKIQDKEKKFLIASIGPFTSKSIIKNGYKPDVEAKEHTIKGLVDAILEYEKKQSISNKGNVKW